MCATCPANLILTDSITLIFEAHHYAISSSLLLLPPFHIQIFHSALFSRILFATTARLALERIQPPIHLVLGALSSGVKQSERGADHSPPSSAKFKKAWSYTSTLPNAFMTWCLIKNTAALPLRLFWNALNPCSSLRVGDQNSHPHKIS
jgi:hypothetical protein